MPIAQGLNGILYEGVSPEAAVAALLERDPKAEGIERRAPRI
jgi:hypothetical protein